MKEAGYAGLHQQDQWRQSTHLESHRVSSDVTPGPSATTQIHKLSLGLARPLQQTDSACDLCTGGAPWHRGAYSSAEPTRDGFLASAERKEVWGQKMGHYPRPRALPPA